MAIVSTDRVANKSFAGGHLYVFVRPSSANAVLLELVEAAVSGEAD